MTVWAGRGRSYSSNFFSSSRAKPLRSGGGSAPGRAAARSRDRAEGRPILRMTAEPFDLPAEAEAAAALIERLQEHLNRVGQLYPFRKGMGLAAPQIGVARAAAIVRPPDGDDTIRLFNPRIIDVSDEVDARYEGCLSFFDVRGMVVRPLSIDVEVSELDGGRRVWVFERGIARLVLHEIDHLVGRLYADDLVPDTELLPLEEYRETRARWQY
ncbi:MAG: peptide deformylase [Actinomycetota bacterium]